MNVYFEWNELNPHTRHTMCVCVACVSFLMYNLYIISYTHMCVTFVGSSVCCCSFGTTFLCFSFHKHEINRIPLAVTRWAFRVCMCVHFYFFHFFVLSNSMVVDCFVCIHLYALSHNIRYNINMKNQFDEKTTTTTTSPNCKFNQKINHK